MHFNIEPFKQMVPESMYEEHLDFNTLFLNIKFKYIRNSYRWNSNFKNTNWVMTNFDYKYANKNNCFENFKQIQSSLYKYRKNYKLNQWNKHYEAEYINFIYTSMEKLVNNISIPIIDTNDVMQSLISKYQKIFDEEDEIDDSDDSEVVSEPPNKKQK